VPSSRTVPLPADDPGLDALTLDELELRWSEAAGRTAITAEAMTGADRKAQALGIPGERLMEHAGTAVAAAARALVAFNAREGRPVVVLAGPGNNGGDGFVAARRLATWGTPVIAVLVAAGERPGTPDALTNWKRLDEIPGVTRIHAPVARDVAILGQGIEKASIVVDALLGTGVRGQLREPVRTAVEVIRRAREAGIPVLAVDTPTAVDLTSGDPSDPVVRADLTVTFHRPKTGLRTRMGRALAGRVLVAPIGIPPEADRT
jgi:NAD(P)H-hydrate epimerase